MALPTVVSFSASSSGMSRPNSSSRAMTSSTVSSESAPRSSMKDAVSVTWSSLMLSLSATIALTFFNSSSFSMLTSSIYLKPLSVHPAVDVDDLACDVRCLVGQQELDRLGHILRGSHPLHRDHLQESLLDSLGKALRHGGLDIPRGDAVHRYLAAGHFPGQGLGEPDDPRFRGGIVGLPGIPHDAHDRGDVDDPAKAVADHRPDSRPGEVEHTVQVHRQDGVPFLLPHPHQVIVPRDAGVVDQVVDPLILPDDSFDDVRGLVEAGGIGRMDRGASAVPNDSLGHPLEFLALGIAQKNQRPFFGQLEGNRLSNSLGRAGNQGTP